ncbi:DNA-methyltransferase [Cohnella suwonensis]|uniref:Methyltransferase n=1 Tax=Cohnella suwonensis TaxID=696072 RepID=A0ABW0LRA6_9BACL
MIIHGNCSQELRKLPDASVESVVTDPPYGLSKEPDAVEVLAKWLAGKDYEHHSSGFMGKSWDSFVPGPAIWREVYRVLKPGGYALVFAGTRTQDLMTIALRLAGFEVRDVIEWLYFSGFPKSMDVGKSFDRRRDEDMPYIYAVTRFIAEGRDRSGKTNRDIDDYFGTSGMAGHWTSQASQPQVPKIEQWNQLKRFLMLTDKMDSEVWRLNGRKGQPGDSWGEREKIGEAIVSGDEGTAGGFKNGIASLQNAGSTKRRVIDITAPATELAKQWKGWGTALKPAHEPIIVVRKPLIGTVAENVEKKGTGALNIDGCRVADESKQEMTYTVKRFAPGATIDKTGEWKQDVDFTGTMNAGRFPANCVTTDEDAFYSPYFNVSPLEISKKASKADRGNCNTHPTVKPTELMGWLVRLVTPPGGVVLDPFAGSGSTLVAAKREGFDFIGIEREAEYIKIIETRTGVTRNMSDEEWEALMA